MGGRRSLSGNHTLHKLLLNIGRHHIHATALTMAVMRWLISYAPPDPCAAMACAHLHSVHGGQIIHSGLRHKAAAQLGYACSPRSQAGVFSKQ